MINDRINFPTDALIDTVSIFDDVALSRDEILALSTDMPCAEKFKVEPGASSRPRIESASVSFL